MNFLHVLSQFEVNGVETHVATLSDERIESGHKVTIVSDTFDVPTRADILCQPIGKRDYPQRVKNIVYLAKLIKERNIDIVNAHSRAASWVSYFASRWTRTPLISSIHMRQHLHLSTKLFSVYGEKLIAVCEAIYSHLQNDLHYPENKLALIHNPINLSQWDYRPRNGAGHEKKIVAFVGRFTGFKGDVLITLVEKVFPEVIRHYKNVEFHIVGGMSDKERIVESVARANKWAGTNFIVLNGFIPNIQDVYHQADVVIGSGRVAMEALACGNLVVSIGESNDIGIVSEETKKQAVLSNFGDLDIRKPINVRHSVDAIVTALKNPGVVSPAWGRTFIEENYNSKIIANKLGALYTELLESRSRRFYTIVKSSAETVMNKHL